MIIQEIDTISFRLNEFCDFSFLSKYGNVFCVFDETGSGCISFGVKDRSTKYFIKIAGAKTIKPYISTLEAIDILKHAVQIYEKLQHPHLIQLVEHYELDHLYIAVFSWSEGDCLFDHWNFEEYKQNPNILPPSVRFKQLPTRKKLDSFNVILDFLTTTATNGYVAVDFYDGSILYDFITDTTTICDIDFFRASPTINELGVDFFGTKRLKAPEEYRYGDRIDETTNVFTMGALIFHYFGDYSDAEIKQMYQKNEFIPCRIENWTLTEQLYKIAHKAVAKNRTNRYRSIADFHDAWNQSLYPYE